MRFGILRPWGARARAPQMHATTIRSQRRVASSRREVSVCVKVCSAGVQKARQAPRGRSARTALLRAKTASSCAAALRPQGPSGAYSTRVVKARSGNGARSACLREEGGKGVCARCTTLRPPARRRVPSMHRADQYLGNAPRISTTYPAPV